MEEIDVRMKLGPSPSQTTRDYSPIPLANDTNPLIEAQGC
jgi:hypothetical protein